MPEQPDMTAVFKSAAAADAAVEQLRAAGFENVDVDRHQTPSAQSEQHQGQLGTGGQGLFGGPNPAVAGGRPDLAAGPIGTMIGMASGGTVGGAEAAGLNLGLDEATGDHLERQRAAGETMVTVASSSRAAEARAILTCLGGTVRTPPTGASTTSSVALGTVAHATTSAPATSGAIPHTGMDAPASTAGMASSMGSVTSTTVPGIGPASPASTPGLVPSSFTADQAGDSPGVGTAGSAETPGLGSASSLQGTDTPQTSEGLFPTNEKP